MTVPVRLRLSRAKGFDLQALSRQTNGLRAIKVDRSTRWGNPFDFRSSEYCWLALAFGCRGDVAGRREASVRAFRGWIAPGDGLRVMACSRRVMMEGSLGSMQIGAGIDVGAAPRLDEIRAALGGCNLACWCDGAPCHADVLLEVANTSAVAS